MCDRRVRPPQVRNGDARGALLSCDEILAVTLSWVRFDGVTTRLTRPWMWREPSMAPLYASGSELSWHEKAWEQGDAPRPSSATTYDVPAFVAAVAAIRGAPGWRDLSEEQRVESLFGRDGSTPASRIGRYCSLNLRRLTTYGTLEVRRFHGSADPAVNVAWARFVVGFVEAFRTAGMPLLAAVLDASPAHEGLRALCAAQESASVAELCAMAEGHIDAETVALLLADACPAAVGVVGCLPATRSPARDVCEL